MACRYVNRLQSVSAALDLHSETRHACLIVGLVRLCGKGPAGQGGSE
jgi:hypothetical protein